MQIVNSARINNKEWIVEIEYAKSSPHIRDKNESGIVILGLLNKRHLSPSQRQPEHPTRRKLNNTSETNAVSSLSPIGHFSISYD